MIDQTSKQPIETKPILPVWGHVLLFSILTAFCLSPIWISAHVPSQNGPWYLLLVHMFREFANPVFDYPEYYSINWHPVPHMFHNILVCGLSYLMPMLTAEKVALSIYVIGLPLSVFYFLSAAAPQNKFLGYFSFLMVHTYSFWRGYHNFSISLVLAFTLFGYWLHHRQKLRVIDYVVMALLTLVLYLSHLFIFALLSCCIGFYVLIETGSFKKGTISALSATWPGWILFVDYFIFTKTQSEWIKHEDTTFLMPHEAIEYFVRKFFYTVSFPAYILAAIPWLILFYLVSRRAVSTLRKPDGGVAALFKQPFWSLFAVLLFGFFIVPYKFLAWHYVNLRMIPVILLVMLAYAGATVPLSRQIRGLVISIIAIASLGVSVLISQQVVKMEAELDVYLSGIDHYEGNTPLLPIHVENTPYGQVRPLTRAHEYYNIAKGGANGFGVAKVNTLVSMWYHEYPITNMFPKYKPDNLEESMKRIRETYGYVLMYGMDEEIQKNLAENQFEQVFENGKLRLFKNESGDYVGYQREKK